ncbi:MAG TPA: GNAT family N-acetyltransferase [Solirubrobacteraceae bacterium]|nr:GNAT family N-acetyltransferase [Solirubrobacteraceae bacterium]
MLEPLRVAHADELAPVLDDQKLHEFIGGRPATAPELRERFERQTRGHSPDERERWLNWVVRLKHTGEVVGTAQVTVKPDDADPQALIAWVIATKHQGQGLAKEAAGLVATWLRGQGIDRLGARIHPRHAASIAVARSIGLAPTPTTVDGEIQWQSAKGAPWSSSR